VDARILFWAGALLNMGAILALMARGVRQIRRGEPAAHRRSMLTAGALVIAFLLSYVLKRSWIGGEDLSVWSDAALWNLYIHETMVLGMLLAGALAYLRGRRLAVTRRVTGRPDDPPADATALAGHRRVGWTAIGAALLGFLTACGILAGMVLRAA